MKELCYSPAKKGDDKMRGHEGPNNVPKNTLTGIGWKGVLNGYIENGSPETHITLIPVPQPHFPF